MSLNSIKFEPADIALLFKNSIVEIDSEKSGLQKEIQTSPQTAEWKFLGDNKKQILVVVRYADVVLIPDKQLSFLTKLMAACNLNLADVAIFNFQNYNGSDFVSAMNYFNPKVVLLFDIKPSDFGLPMNFPEFQVQTYKDSVFVTSPSLETIEPDKVMKSKLWVSLKKIFNL